MARTPRHWIRTMLAMSLALALALAAVGAEAAAVVATVPSGGMKPYEIAVNQATSRAYVTHETSNTVSIFDLTTPVPALVGTTPVGTAPRGVAVNPTTGRVYVANYKSNTVSV